VGAHPDAHVIETPIGRTDGGFLLRSLTGPRLDYIMFTQIRPHVACMCGPAPITV